MTSSASFYFKDGDIRVGCGGTMPNLLCVTVTGLLPDHVYSFRVATITDASGVSTYSDVSPPTTTLPVSLPAQPPVPPALTKKARMTSLSLYWHAPYDDGGLPLLGYLLERQEDFAHDWTNQVVVPADGDVRLAPLVKTGGRSVRSTGPEPPTAKVGYVANRLNPGHHYRFRVAAITAEGVGPWSDMSELFETPVDGEGAWADADGS